MNARTYKLHSGPYKTKKDLEEMEDQRPYWEFRHVTIKQSVEALEAELRRRKIAEEAPMEADRGQHDSSEIKLLFDLDACEPVLPNDPRIIAAYEEYLSLPLATIRTHPEIYSKWVVLTGRACAHPHPHRHFTGGEFYNWVGYDPEMAARFLKPLPDANRQDTAPDAAQG